MTHKSFLAHTALIIIGTGAAVFGIIIANAHKC